MNTNKDLRFLQAAVDELEDYLQSSELFWPLSGHGVTSDLPRLTLGGLFLALKRGQAQAVSAGGRAQIQQLQTRIEHVLMTHRALKEKKAARELHSRLHQWSNFLREYQHDPDTHAGAYRYEVRWRVMVSLLLPHLATEIHVRPAVDDLDAVLKAFFLPGEFIWDAALRSAFPQDTFWYLYGLLKN